MAMAQLAAKSFDLVSMVVVARVLTPAEFGLVALAASVLLVANSVTELPIMDVLVRKSELLKADFDAAFTLNALRGALISAVLFAISYPVALLMKDTRIALIIQVLSIAPVVQGLGSPMMAKHMKQLNYLPMAQAQLMGKLIAFIGVILLVWCTRSYWALVAGLVASPVITAVFTHINAPYRPKLSLSGVRDILKFAGWVTASRIVFTLNQHTDRFFVGAILGKASLGHYAMGSDIASTATYTIANPVMQPLFAGMALVRDDQARLTRAYLKGQQIMVTMIAPIGCGLAVLAPPLVELVLGREWSPVAVVIQWLAPVIAMQMLSVPVQSLAMAMGQPRLLVWREAGSMLLRLPVTLIAAWQFGLTGAAVARGVSGLVIVFMNLTIAQTALGVSVVKQFKNCHRSLISVSIMSALVGLISNSIIPIGEGVIWKLSTLAISVLCGAIIYFSALFLIWRLEGEGDSAELWLIERCQSVANKVIYSRL